MISFDEAKRIISQHSPILGNELVSIDDADGRVLAEAILADRDYPPFNRSAMDGYALVHEDWVDGIREYRVAETILAGQPSSEKLEKGYCYKIMTGAAVPAPANVVIRVEDSVSAGDQVRLTSPGMRPYMNIARQGEDLLLGDVVVNKHTRLTPQLISILAAVGCGQVPVKKIPSVAVVTTGDEVVPLGSDPLPYQIRNSNAYLIRSMLKSSGIEPRFLTHVPDDKARIKKVLENALNSELVIINGGVSAGDADYVPQLLENLNVKKLFHKVAIRPGKPIWVGAKPNGGLVFALPGNPFSCMVTFSLFVKLFLNLSQGLNAPHFLKLPFVGARPKKVNLDEFFPVRLNPDTMTVQAVTINGSGDIRLGLNADAIALHPLSTDVINDGDLIYFLFL